MPLKILWSVPICGRVLTELEYSTSLVEGIAEVMAEVGVKAHRDANLIVIRDPDILVGT
jgi:hypothetical protein